MTNGATHWSFGFGISFVMTKAGYSLIEVLVGITVFVVALAIIIVSLRGFLAKKSVETAAENLSNTIRLAQSNAIASQGDAPLGQVAYPSDWGVHFDLDGPGPIQDDRYWVFRGVSFDPAQSQVYMLPADVRLADLALGSMPYLDEINVIFTHVSGEADKSGSIVLAHRTTGDQVTVSVLPSGEVQVGTLTIPADSPTRVSDSRHVHASLITPLPANAVVTLDFPDSTPDVVITAGSYIANNIFDYTSTASSQYIRLHTHTPTTQANPLLSIDRDRRKNTLAVSVKINFQDGGGDRTVVSYDAAGVITAGSGATQMVAQ